jgi:hypothetical protein
MSRIGERREKILKYISKHNCDPLLFKDPYIPNSPITNLQDTENIDALVWEIIKLSARLGSYNSTMNYVETYSGKMRSSLDIWRHAKSVKPDIDIFTIMESIYRLKDQVYGHYCTTVKRVVFMLPRYGSGVRNILCREYNIKFSTWRKLHE